MPGLLEVHSVLSALRPLALVGRSVPAGGACLPRFVGFADGAAAAGLRVLFLGASLSPASGPVTLGSLAGFEILGELLFSGLLAEAFFSLPPRTPGFERTGGRSR